MLSFLQQSKQTIFNEREYRRELLDVKSSFPGFPELM